MTILRNYKDYNESVLQNREYRKTFFKEFLYLSDELECVIRQYNDASLTDVKYSDLIRFNIGEVVALSKDVTTLLEHVYLDKLEFVCTMSKGSTLGLHAHSDCSEAVVIESGEMLDLTTKKHYYKGDTVYYNKREKHNPVAVTDLVMTVIFIKE